VANRIILKKSRDERGNEKTSYEWIKDYLRLNGEKRFGEIKQYLADHGIRYANDKGLDLALKSLMEQGDIGKHKAPTNSFLHSYPVYYLKKTKLNYISAIAQQFDDKLFRSTNGPIKLPKQNKESDEKYLIRNLIHAYGIYVLFVFIKGWKLTSDKNTRSLNSEIISTWLKYTLTSGLIGFFLEEGITELVGSKGDDAVDIEDSYKLYANKKKWSKLLELEKLFQKTYPDHFEFFEKLFNNPLEQPTTIKELNKIIMKNTKKNNMTPEEIEKIIKEI